ncbi:uncharacterized protein [Aegilops tauschii subsp. strangulata]|uniref:uncharacterized protein n=1 Tax=Aegilops tauschii subsp. strangulata TaxID=200361 RepID=UPI003CC870AD
MQLVSGGQTAISVDGEVGHFFRNKRGLRQGDPMSPILFNFVVDALAAMLRRATEAGHIKGVMGHLIPGGISHLQYADDTLLLFQPDLHTVATVKALLLSFEIMSGLNINFHKCEVLPMGLEAEEGRRIADLLNCKVGKLQFTYLGLPLDAKRITIDGWAPLWTKVGDGSVRGGASSSPPQPGVHAKMDTPRSRFFWEGSGPKRKYHMISQGATGLWIDLLRAKYFPNGNFFEGAARGSPFWNDLQAIRPAFAMGAKFNIGDGRSAGFWLDFWVRSQPLWLGFQDLYALAVNPDQSVASALASSPPRRSTSVGSSTVMNKRT